MDILPPLMRGIQLHLRHNHFRLYQLANLILKGKHSEFMSGLTNDDPWLNEDTQVTLLHFAAAGGTVESIDYCLQQGIAINTPDKHGNTPLTFASLCGNEKVISYLQANGADKQLRNKRGQLPWQVALTGRLLAMLYTEKGTVPTKSLYEAVLDEDITTVEQLLVQGVHPNLLNHADYQVELQLPLHLAVKTKNLDIVQLLLKHGADPKAPYHYAHVPLETAIRNQQTEMVELLLDYGADPDHDMGSRPYSLLHLAVKNDLLDIIELLLQHGADPEVQIAGHYFYHPPLREARSKAAIQLLIDYGANTNPTKMQDFLIWPMGRDDLTTTEAFIEIGVPVKNGELWREAIRGTKERQLAFCKLFLSSGLDVNAPMKYGDSALIQAIHYQNAELVQLFMKHGADVTAVEVETNYSAYQLAVHLSATTISEIIASKLKQLGLPIPSIQPAPSVKQVAIALAKERDDLIQLSLYTIVENNPYEKLRALKQILDYPSEVFPFAVNVEQEEDETEDYEDDIENYKPSLHNYEVVYHPNDLRQFLLCEDWYDDYTYTSIFHFHIRCKRNNTTKVKQLLEHWKQQEDKYEQRYHLGLYIDDQNTITEADQHYLAATTAIAKISSK